MEKENTLMPTESVRALKPGTKTEPVSEVTKHQKLKFISDLQNFILGRTGEEAEQKEMLDVATEQFKGAPINLINENCSKCYGRGFTAYNSNYKYYTMCSKCFNQNL